MKTSARNQFSGKVTEIIDGVVYAEVVVELAGGERVVASVTKESVKALDIKPGGEVIALIKAPQIVIVADFGGYKISARNQLAGTITEVKPGAVNTEIDLDTAGGQQISATVTNESASSLGLKKGQTVTAVFKAGAVLLATKA
ncbi:TOBE domain-containing protein [Methylomonas koyamae]|uniref:Transporter n=1 Tax=Methylomonas koyamae TaxID=702114 RepID=A0AA91DD39_9GAMM|nr:TOBE domain-containing protein [Methylomonas koyamae]OAI26882.1 transporter [Methylomonas koyamae]WNB74962.1 TOBE domain-containing protein [Methylomonas koyamae]